MSNQPSPDREKLREEIERCVRQIAGEPVLAVEDGLLDIFDSYASHQVATALKKAKEKVLVDIHQGNDGSGYSQGWYKAMDFVQARIQGLISDITQPQEPEETE